ncbi:MAG: Ig-like domain-containing protein [Myxococcales bacterium]
MMIYAPLLSINNPTTNEGNGTMTFTVSLSQASAKTISVNYATANGTATAGSDYTATTGALTFNSGDTTKTFTVPVLEDTAVETAETIRVNLSNATNAALGVAQGTGTITDNDSPTLSINNVTVNETSGTATLTVSLSAPSALPITVHWATADGTATASDDYSSNSGNLTFNPGVTTRTINVTINQDADTELEETFKVALSNATNAQLPTGTQGVVTIRANGPLTVAYATYTVPHDKPFTFNVAANAQGGSGSPLQYTLVVQADHGSVIVVSGTTLKYTPRLHYVGEDSFAYDLKDGTYEIPFVQAEFNVVENAPVGLPDSYTLGKGTTLSGQNVLTNDSDADNDALTAVLDSSVTHGTLALWANGNFTYTPATTPGLYEGTDQFTYHVTDGITSSAPVTVTLTVVSLPPVANAEPALNVVHDHALTGNVLSNDVSPYNKPLVAQLVSSVATGTLSLQPNGNFTFTPTAGFLGDVSFKYRVTDGNLTSGIATNVIHVVNHTPTALPDAYTVTHDHGLAVSSVYLGILANDPDADYDTLTASVNQTTAHGKLSLNSDGTFTYTPDPTFAGSDSFTYTASDGVSASNVATVTIQVVETVPTASNVSVSNFPHDKTLVRTLAAAEISQDADLDSLSFVLVESVAPDKGIVRLHANGDIAYSPPPNWTGTAQFKFAAYDGLQYSLPATYTIQVVEHAPVAVADSFTVVHDHSLNAPSVLNNDTDADGSASVEPLAARLVSGAGVQHGLLAFNSDGTFVYQPAAGYSGSDAFQYRVFDGRQYSSPVTVTISVAEHAPLSVADLAVVGHDRTLTGNVLANDTGSGYGRNPIGPTCERTGPCQPIHPQPEWNLQVRARRGVLGD